VLGRIGLGDLGAKKAWLFVGLCSR
jgi:hypothetical protein